MFKIKLIPYEVTKIRSRFDKYFFRLRPTLSDPVTEVKWSMKYLSRYCCINNKMIRKLQISEMACIVLYWMYLSLLCIFKVLIWELTRRITSFFFSMFFEDSWILKRTIWVVWNSSDNFRWRFNFTKSLTSFHSFKY